MKTTDPKTMKAIITSETTVYVPVFHNVGRRNATVYIATLDGNRLGKRVSECVLLDFCGDIRRTLEAFNNGDEELGSRILSNLA